MIASFVFDLDSTVLKGELLPAIGAWKKALSLMMHWTKKHTKGI